MKQHTCRETEPQSNLKVEKAKIQPITEQSLLAFSCSSLLILFCIPRDISICKTAGLVRMPLQRKNHVLQVLCTKTHTISNGVQVTKQYQLHMQTLIQYNGGRNNKLSFWILHLHCNAILHQNTTQGIYLE